MNTLIEAGRVWYVDCTPDNTTGLWNIASPNEDTLYWVMKALWRKVDNGNSKKAAR